MDEMCDDCFHDIIWQLEGVARFVCGGRLRGCIVEEAVPSGRDKSGKAGPCDSNSAEVRFVRVYKRGAILIEGVGHLELERPTSPSVDVVIVVVGVKS